MNHRSLCAMFLGVVLLCGNLPMALATGTAAGTTNATAAPAEPDYSVTTFDSYGQPNLAGPHCCLMDADTGEVLLDKKAEEACQPASITKVMTALLVFENCDDLQKQITVSEMAVNSVEADSTTAYLVPGETVTIDQMLNVCLIRSANDAANVLAECVGGTLDNFASMMTARAKELGCTNTNFVNANGLSNDNHYTTAHDMARIMQAVIKYPYFSTITSTPAYDMPPTNKFQKRTFYCKQELLKEKSKFYYTAAFASKNGYTKAAHQTLVTAAKKNGRTLIAVTMGSIGQINKNYDAIAMFNYGFDKCHAETIPAATLAQKAGYNNVQAFPDLSLLLPNGYKETNVTYNADDKGNVTLSLPELNNLTLLTVTPSAEDTPITDTQDTDKVATAAETAATVDPPSGIQGFLSSFSPVQWILTAIIIVLVIALLLLSIRSRNIRRRRARARAMRSRYRQRQRR